MKEVRANKNIVYRCWYHVVWCPKWRRKVLTSEDASVENPPIEGDPGPVDVRLREIIEEVAEESGSIVEELEVMPDHVHLLVSVDPQFGVGKFIRLCKGRSSRLLRAEFPSLKRRLPTLWTNSYFVATVGGAPLSVIAQYIENQRSV
jgi:putative transposase